MLINCTNHPHANWSAAQMRAALDAYGDVVDYPFPAVDPHLDEAQLTDMAERLCCDLLALGPDAVLCQGEMGLCFTLVSALQQHGVPVLHACSERRVCETQTPEGSLRKSVFVFAGFRRYPVPENLRRGIAY